MNHASAVAVCLLAGWLAVVAGCNDSDASDAPRSPTDALNSSDAATTRLTPDDLEYVGAFRLPGPSGGSNWGWSGEGMAYRPGGDPEGPDDGYPGALYGVGHDHHVHVSEISIPAPKLSKAKNTAELPTARTLRPFTDVRKGRFLDYELPHAGLAFLPPGGKQPGRLYVCFGQHMHETFDGPSHGWCEPDLSGTAGFWRVGGLREYVTADYMFTADAAWADRHVGGARVWTGRYRDGGQGAQGPSIVAIAPCDHNKPPKDGATLEARALLMYTAVTDEAQHTMKNYHHADEWAGAAWLAGGDKAAVVFVGTKGLGTCWYGFANGVVWPDEPPFPEIPDPPNNDRGWWSSQFTRQMIFYDPADLAQVAAGTMKPHEPQPYAVMDLDPVLYSVKGKQQKYVIRACAADRERGRLYVFERLADEDDRSLVHVWQVKR